MVKVSKKIEILPYFFLEELNGKPSHLNQKFVDKKTD